MDEFDIYTSDVLIEVMFDPRQTISTSPWRRFLQPSRTIFSEQEEIRFDKLEASRRVAPFMHANAPGRPIYRGDGESIRLFRPAYTKPKDAVRPGEFLAKTGPESSRRIPLQTPESRMNQRIINILNFHRESIERLWDYMYAKALMDGRITMRYMSDDGNMAGQVVTLDYDRAMGHTLDANAFDALYDLWSAAGANVWDSIQSIVDTVAAAEFGGPVTDILMGSSAARAFLNYFNDGSDQGGRSRLQTDITGAEQVRVSRGIVRTDPMNPFTYLGQLDSNLDCWKVSGAGNQFQNDDKSFVDVMGEWDVVFVAPAVEMIQAYGAILEVNELRATDIHVKMFDEQDPSVRYIMSQSSPLPIVVNPNATFKATVGR